MLFSTVGVAKTTHYCMGHEMMSKIGFGEKHLNCGMDSSAENKDENQSTDPNSCCKNITEHIQVDDDIQLKHFEIKLNLDFTFAFFKVVFFGINYLLSFESEVIPYLSPTPPDDLHILYDTFLI